LTSLRDRLAIALVLIKTTNDGERYLDLLARCLTGLIYPESAWRQIVKFAIQGQVIPLPHDLMMVQKSPMDRRQREEGRDMPLFAYTMVGLKRLENIRWCIEQVLTHDVPGDLVETGVWRGGSCIFMRALLKIYGVADRTVWAADSFEGLPKPGPIDKQIAPQQPDLSSVNALAVSLEQVQENFRAFDLLDDRVRFLKGWFKDTLPQAPIERLAILRLDGDLFESTMDALQALYHKVSPGGFVIVDDYNSWESCRAAVTQFREQCGITAEIKTIDWTGVFWQVPRG
jgi:O-methyltransferase